MRVLQTILAASAYISVTNAELLYSRAEKLKLDGNPVSLPGTEAISGNIARTLMFSVQNDKDDLYGAREVNYMECGDGAYQGICAKTFAVGRWYDSQWNDNDFGLTAHTGCGGYLDPVSLNSPDLPYDTEWHHIAHVWDGTTHSLYWDGELISSSTDNNGTLDTTAGCYAGSKDSRFPFSGTLANIEVHNEAKDAAYIKAAFDAAPTYDTYRVENAKLTGWRPLNRDVEVFRDGGCTDKIDYSDITYLRSGANDPDYPAENGFDGDRDTFWRANCNPCRAGEIWAEFEIESSIPVHCVRATNIGEGSGSTFTWNGGINVLKNGRNYAGLGVSHNHRNDLGNAVESDASQAEGLCTRQQGRCTGTFASRTKVGTVNEEKQCMELCMEDGGASACDMELTASLQLDCYKITQAAGESITGADGSADNSCYDLSACAVPLDRMISWFRGEDANGTVWPSAVGTIDAETVYWDSTGDNWSFDESGNGSRGRVKGWAGDPTVKSQFGEILGPRDTSAEWTMCAATRYTGDTWGRILQGGSSNWLFNQHSGDNGVFHNESWVTYSRSYKIPTFSREWTIGCGSNKDGTFIVNGTNVGDIFVTRYGHPGDVRVNSGFFADQKADFQISEVMTWSRTLTDEEKLSVVNYITGKMANDTEYATPPYISASTNTAGVGLSCGDIPEVRFESLWSNINGRTHVDVVDGRVAFEVTGRGGGINIIFVNSADLPASGDLTEATAGVELFIGGSNESVIHASSCLGCAPSSDAITPLVNDVIAAGAFSGLYVTINGSTISVFTGKFGDASSAQVFEYDFGTTLNVDRAIFSHGYGDLECTK